jgi:large subunit ribosomal protein L23
MPDLHSIIVEPIVTEKSSLLRADSVYVFKVLKDSSKSQIRDAVEKAFGVTVDAVNTTKVRGKSRTMGRHIGRTSGWKKAYVRLKQGDKIKQLEVGS